MTVQTSSRVAGFTFLFYIATGISTMVLFSQATAGGNLPSRLISVSQHTAHLQSVFLLSLLSSLSAFVLGVALYAITRGHDRDLAMLAMVCRVAEGIAILVLPSSLALLWWGKANTLDPASAGSWQTLGAFLLNMDAWNPAALFFALGSAIFAWLLLRGRLIPAAIAWLGVFASVLLVLLLPLQLAGLLKGLLAGLMWLPMLAFEPLLAFWLIIKGASSPSLPVPSNE